MDLKIYTESNSKSLLILQDHPLWKLGHLNHVAIAVPNIDNAVNFYKNILGVDQVSEALVSFQDSFFYILNNNNK